MTQAPRHRPYLTSGVAFEIGLRPMDMAQWLDVGADHAAFMAEKRARLAGRPPLYYGSLESSVPAQAELLRLVVANLTAQHAGHYDLEGDRLIDRVDGSRHDLLAAGREPLDVLGGLAEEDFVLFAPGETGDRVIAASNAYSSSGRIVACVGRDMRFAHAPVPRLNDDLGARIDRVIGNVRAGQPVVRFNWFVTPLGSRLFPEGSHDANVQAGEQAARLLAEDHRKAGDRLFLRVERQSFVRLPETGALAFAIHTYSDPLSVIAADRDSLSALARLLADYSDERLAYGGMLATRPAILRWIADRLGG